MLVGLRLFAQTGSPPAATIPAAPAATAARAPQAQSYAAAREAMRAAIESQRASADLQREAVRRQAASAGRWTPPFEPAAAPEEASCPPMPESVVAPILEKTAREQDIQSRLLRAVVGQESSFRPCATSPKGAMGLMQLMPATAARYGVRDPFDPQANVDAGAKLLKELLTRYGGNLPLALGAYNAGPGAVDDAGGLPDFPETRDYVETILNALK